jgi:hypothetical protein
MWSSYFYPREYLKLKIIDTITIRNFPSNAKFIINLQEKPSLVLDIQNVLAASTRIEIIVTVTTPQRFIQAIDDNPMKSK